MVKKCKKMVENSIFSFWKRFPHILHLELGTVNHAETRFFHIFWHIFRFFGIFFDFLAFFKNMQILGKSGKIAFFGIARNIGFVGSG